MRRLALLGAVSLALATAAACATSEDAMKPEESEPETSIPDASTREVAVGSDVSDEGRGPQCNAEGWCETTLPDLNLVLMDVWPLADRAFAIAESYSSGIKVLEWTSTDSTWRYIDDNSQNEEKVGAELATAIWSPGADEVYYAVAPGTIFHGRRPEAPATAWTWSSRKLEDNNPSKVAPSTVSRKRAALGVWGTDGNDVHAWFSNTIFRKSGDVDAIEWLPEYVANDFDAPDEQLFIAGITGVPGGDLSFVGVRRRGDKSCAVVGRRAVEGYRRIADAILPQGYGACTARPDVPLVSGAWWPRAVQSLDDERLLVLAEFGEVRLIAPSDGGHAITATTIPTLNDAYPDWRSMWVESGERQWILGTLDTAKGYAAVAQFDRIWEEGGPYRFSSIAQNGAPLVPEGARAPIVRGGDVGRRELFERSRTRR
ncbi:MAG: hypothetical protein K0S65_5751 [Labilithrix sp.]|nr:hypothetical protein [Labilithrix sp.]